MQQVTLARELGLINESNVSQLLPMVTKMKCILMSWLIRLLNAIVSLPVQGSNNYGDVPRIIIDNNH
jgi:hypothetical protein